MSDEAWMEICQDLQVAETNLAITLKALAVLRAKFTCSYGNGDQQQLRSEWVSPDFLAKIDRVLAGNPPLEIELGEMPPEITDFLKRVDAYQASTTGARFGVYGEPKEPA